MPVWLRPTANFGIGLQSCFMVTDKITIYTNSNSDSAYKLTFKSGKQEGYVNVESIQDFNTRGSKVVIEVANNFNFSYNLSGFTEKNLRNIDPFESNCVIIYKLIESIYSECYSSFFDINVISESIKFSDKIQMNMFKGTYFPTKVLKKDILYDFQKENGIITYWYNNNIYKISPNKHSHGVVNVKFKGKQVPNTKIYGCRYIGFVIDIDIYGIATKNALSLNREELNFEASAKVNEDIQFLIREYFDFLQEQAENIDINTNLADIFMLTSWRFDKKFPKKLCQKLSDKQTIRILQLNNIENKCCYKVEERSLCEISELYPNIPYIKGEIISKNEASDYITSETITEQELIEILDNSSFDKEQNKILIIDRMIKYFFSNTYTDITYLNTDKQITICKIPSFKELYDPDEYTKSRLIRELVFDGKSVSSFYSSNMRRSIPAFKDFSKLAVDINGLNFIGHTNLGKWNIISPISLKNSEKINEFSKEAFVNYIIEQPVFENIVQYVSNHGVEKNSKEVIINEYKRLIECYYDTVK